MRMSRDVVTARAYCAAPAMYARWNAASSVAAASETAQYVNSRSSQCASEYPWYAAVDAAASVAVDGQMNRLIECSPRPYTRATAGCPAMYSSRPPTSGKPCHDALEQRGESRTGAG